MTNTSIRDRVFETNSSSSHSVTVAEGDLHAATFPAEMLRAGRIEIALGTYGWEWKRYYRPENKLAYILTDLDGNHAATRNICSIVEEHTGCRVVIDQDSRSRSYIEGRSGGTSWEVRKSPEALMGFLLSAESYVQTGNDNMPCGEHVETDRGPEIFHPSHYADVPAGSERFRIRFDHGMNHVLFETDGETIERSIDDFMTKILIGKVFVDATIVRATVSPERTGYSIAEPVTARDIVHIFLAQSAVPGEAPPVNIMRDAEIVVGPAPEGPYARLRSADYIFDMVLDLECVATAETIRAIRAAVETVPVPAVSGMNRA